MYILFLAVMFLQQAINVTVNFPNLAGDEFVVLFGVCRWCEITYVHMTHRPYQCLVLKHAKWILSMFCKTSQPMYIVLTWNIMFMFVLLFFSQKSLPMLRLALVRNQMKIDGVNAPPRDVVQGLPATSAPRPTLVSSARPQVRNC